jgi:hypothetical protein
MKPGNESQRMCQRVGFSKKKMLRRDGMQLKIKIKRGAPGDMEA